MEKRNKSKTFSLVAIVSIFAIIGFVSNVGSEELTSGEMNITVEAGGVLNLFGGEEQAEGQAEEQMLGGTTNFDTLGVDDVYLNGADGYINFTTTTGSDGYGIRNNAGIVECKNSGGNWGACTSATPGDEGWLADATNHHMYPATNAGGGMYPVVFGATASTSIAGTTDVFMVVGNSSFTGNIIANGGNFVGNDAGAALDFSWEGDTDTALFVVDGSGDKVGISEATPTYTLDVGGDISMDDKLYHNGDADSYLSWDAVDNFTLLAGNLEFLNFTEDAQDIAEFGDGTDIDFIFNDMMHIAGDTGFVGIGDDTTADTMLEVVDATGPQVTIAHTDAVDYYTIDVDANGDVDIIASGGNIDHGNENIYTTGNFSAGNITGSGALIIDTDTIYTDATNNSIGIGTTTPNTTGASLSVYDEIEIFDDTSPYDLLIELVDSADDGLIKVFEDGTQTAQIAGATATASYFDTNLLYIDGSANKVYVATSTIGSTEDSVLTVMEGLSIFDAAAGYDQLFHFVDSGDDALMKIYENAVQTGQIAGATGSATYFDTDGLYYDGSTDSVGLSTTTPNTTGASLAVFDELEVFDITSPYDTLVELKDSATDVDSGIINLYENGTITGLISGATGEDTYFDTDGFFYDGSTDSIGLSTTTPNTTGASLAVVDELEVFDATSGYDTLVELKDSATDTDSGVINVYENDTITAKISGATGEDSYIDTDGIYYDGSTDYVGISSSTPTSILSIGTTGATSTISMGYICIQASSEIGESFFIRLDPTGENVFATSTVNCSS